MIQNCLIWQEMSKQIIRGQTTFNSTNFKKNRSLNIMYKWFYPKNSQKTANG